MNLGFDHFSSGDLFRALAGERGIDVLQANLSAEENAELDELVDGRLREIGTNEDRKVIDSRTAWHWIPSSFKVFLDLNLQTAAQRILSEVNESRMLSENIHEDPRSYAQLLQNRLDSETRRYKASYGINPYDMTNYDLVVDTGANDIEQVVKTVVSGFKGWL